MKNRATFSGFSLAVLVLLSILTQSVHNLEHLAKFYQEEHCDHHYALNKNEISHSHNDIEHCDTCDFTFGPGYIGIEDHLAQGIPSELPAYIFGFATSNKDFFSGSRSLHRGPPSFIV